MAHLVGRLTALKVAKVKKPGMYADGAGLYLQVTGDGESKVAKSWIYRFTLRGRSREMGLGSPLAPWPRRGARKGGRVQAIGLRGHRSDRGPSSPARPGRA
jgi:hypothetical protein